VIAWMCALLLAVAAKDPLPGIWNAHPEHGELVRIQRVAARTYALQGNGWHATGRLRGRRLIAPVQGEVAALRVPDTLRADIQGDGRLVVRQRDWRARQVTEATWRRGLGDTTSTWHGILNGDQLPVIVKQAPAAYPQAAIDLHVSGTVKLWTLIGSDGTIWVAHVRQSIPLLDAAAIATVKKWRFKPSTADGLPVSVWIEVPLEFKLQ
jgi:TonB family protein